MAMRICLDMNFILGDALKREPDALLMQARGSPVQFLEVAGSWRTGTFY
jgi:hypothetical protein